MTVSHTLELLIDGAAGNVELELLSFVFGVDSFENESRDARHLLTEQERDDIASDLGEDFLEFFPTEYGYDRVRVSSAQAWGVTYSSVLVQPTNGGWDALTPEAIQRLKARAERYLNEHSGYPQSFRGLLHTVTVSGSTATIL